MVWWAPGVQPGPSHYIGTKQWDDFFQLYNGMETHWCLGNSSAAKLDATKFQETHTN